MLSACRTLQSLALFGYASDPEQVPESRLRGSEANDELSSQIPLSLLFPVLVFCVAVLQHGNVVSASPRVHSTHSTQFSGTFCTGSDTARQGRRGGYRAFGRFVVNATEDVTSCEQNQSVMWVDACIRGTGLLVPDIV